MTSAYFRVTGTVQGVGFRWMVRDTAVRLGLAGWVRNLPDGDVELVAGGDSGALDELERALARGPRFARVDSVDRKDLEEEVAAPGFSIQ